MLTEELLVDLDNQKNQPKNLLKNHLKNQNKFTILTLIPLTPPNHLLKPKKLLPKPPMLLLPLLMTRVTLLDIEVDTSGMKLH